MGVVLMWILIHTTDPRSQMHFFRIFPHKLKFKWDFKSHILHFNITYILAESFIFIK